MKRLASLFVVLCCSLCIYAQNLTTRYTYWDWFETKVKCKYTVLPNGHKHGTASYYRKENGKLWGTKTWENNRFKGFKWLFHDGSVECEGKVLSANNSYMETNLPCKEYALYRICNDGKRRLYIKSELYQLSQPDVLSDRDNNYYIESDNYGSYYYGSGICCNVKDWRVKSYSDYHQNGKIAHSFQTSPDYKTETITVYDDKGNITSQQIYNVPNQTLTIKSAVGDKFVIKNNEVVLTSDVDVLTEDGTLLKYKSGSKFKNTPIEMSRKDFYGIMSCAQDTPSQNYAILVNELRLDEIETIIQRSEAISVRTEVAGKQLNMELKYMQNYRRDVSVSIKETLYLTETKDSLSYYSMSYVSPYNEGIDRSIKATYKGAELIHLTYTGNDAPKKYSFAGPIVNNLPHGEWTTMYGDEYGTYEYVGNFTNGVWDGFGIYTVGKGVYEGEFKNWLYNGRGKLTTSSGVILEGEFVDGGLKNGKLSDPNGDYYEGIFENNRLMSGICRQTSYDTLYVGEVNNGNFDGNGKITATSGWIKEGVFRNGQLFDGVYFDGTTTSVYKGGSCIGKQYQYANGDVFLGEMSETSNSAKGIYTFANKDVFDGEFLGCDFGNADKVPFQVFSGTCKVMVDNNILYEGEAVFDGRTQTSVRDIVFNGRGKLTSSDGIFYEGVFSDGKFIEGTCCALKDNGDMYAGEVKNGAFHGQGKLTKTNGDYYEGVFAKGKFGGNGMVTITDDDGFVYTGEYANNKYNGNGTYTFTSGNVIKGNSINGMLSGVCELQYANGDVYKGELKNYLPIGLGEMTYVSGDKFVGMFAKGLRHGEGTLTTHQNSTFVGVWANNAQNGSFVITTSDGSIYNVMYKKGVCGKKATVSFANGDKWEGEIENKTYKKGIYTFADGTMYDGTYENGGVLKVKVIGADGKRIKDVVEYRSLIPLHQEIFE